MFYQKFKSFIVFYKCDSDWVRQLRITRDFDSEQSLKEEEGKIEDE